MGEDYGIYTNIEPTNRFLKDGHRLFRGECKVCGQIIEQRKLQFLKRNTQCQHGFKQTGIKDRRLRRIFMGMKNRCGTKTSTDYDRYGGRGICVDQNWLDSPFLFEQWALTHGYEPWLTIDRIDVDGDYTPNNCRWVSVEDNARYKSTTKLVGVCGETHTGRDWSLMCGLSLNTINTYLRSHSEDDVSSFIAYVMENGLPHRNGANESYIEAYLRSDMSDDDQIEIITYADVIQQEEYLTSNQEAAGS